MTYAAHSSLTSRATSVLFSVAIHAALGFALFASFQTGAPDANSRPGERGEVLVVELISLPEGNAPGHGRESSSRAPSDSDKAGLMENAGDRSAVQRAGITRPIGVPPRGDGGSAETSGLTGIARIEDSRPGAPALSGAEIQAFRSRLLNHIERFRRYPPEAREAGHEGAVRVQFVMDQSGNVLEAWVELSSGSRLLDEEAIAAIMRARPLPAPPAHWPQSFGVSLPIGFSLQ